MTAPAFWPPLVRGVVDSAPENLYPSSSAWKRGLAPDIVWWVAVGLRWVQSQTHHTNSIVCTLFFIYISIFVVSVVGFAEKIPIGEKRKRVKVIEGFSKRPKPTTTHHREEDTPCPRISPMTMHRPAVFPTTTRRPAPLASFSACHKRAVRGLASIATSKMPALPAAVSCCAG